MVQKSVKQPLLTKPSLILFLQDRVEIWEAVLTFLFFPILVIVAYAADKGWLNVIFCQVF